ncbi:hypothetical protein BD626DRAFT_480063 [Schizophyllum amplum]|uniref:C2H2-type domain-containing protein n=1 Tax=Schizophyllum amplum TaxID=97359 RepID=A0A550CSW2_9AGAR|nr:hypothetical protein BD626DRAFT_480063 [Auriculariopsis ampla]
MSNDPYVDAAGAWHNLSDDAKALLSRFWISNATTEADKAHNVKVYAGFIEHVKEQRLAKEHQLAEIYAAQASLEEQRLRLEREVGLSRLAITAPNAPQARIEEVSDTPNMSRRSSYMANSYTSNNGQPSFNSASSSNAHIAGRMHIQQDGRFRHYTGPQTGGSHPTYPPHVPPAAMNGSYNMAPPNTTRNQYDAYNGHNQSTTSTVKNWNPVINSAAPSQQHAAQSPLVAPSQPSRAQTHKQYSAMLVPQPSLATSGTPGPTVQPVPLQAGPSVTTSTPPAAAVPPVDKRPRSQASQRATPVASEGPSRPASRPSIVQVPPAVQSNVSSQPSVPHKPPGQTPIPVVTAGAVQVQSPAPEQNQPPGFFVSKGGYTAWAQEGAIGSCVEITKTLVAQKTAEGRIKFSWKNKAGEQRELMFEPGLKIKSIDADGIPTFERSWPSKTTDRPLATQAAPSTAAPRGSSRRPFAHNQATTPSQAGQSASATGAAASSAKTRPTAVAKSSPAAAANGQTPSTPLRDGDAPPSSTGQSPRTARPKTLVRDIIKMLGGKRPSSGGGEPAPKRQHVETAGSSPGVPLTNLAPSISQPPAAALPVATIPSPVQAQSPAPVQPPAAARSHAAQETTRNIRPNDAVPVKPTAATQPSAPTQPVAPTQSIAPTQSNGVPLHQPNTYAPHVTAQAQLRDNPYFGMAAAWPVSGVAQGYQGATQPTTSAPQAPSFASNSPLPFSSLLSTPQASSSTEEHPGDGESATAVQAPVFVPTPSTPVAPAKPNRASGSKNPTTASTSRKAPAPAAASAKVPERIDLAQKVKESAKKQASTPSSSVSFQPQSTTTILWQRSAATSQQTSQQPAPKAQESSRTQPPTPRPSSRSSPKKTPLFLGSRASTDESDAPEEPSSVATRGGGRKPLVFDCVYIARRPAWVEEDLRRRRRRRKGKRRMTEEVGSTDGMDSLEEAEVSREVDLGGTTSDDGSSVDEEDILRSSFIIPPPNYNRHDPVEADAVALSLSRARQARCKWGECDVQLCSGDRLLRHLVVVHLGSEETSYTCLWQRCAESYPSQRALTAHVEGHARSPLFCAYQDCDRTYRNGHMLLQHHQLVHRSRDAALRPSAEPCKPEPNELQRPPLPKAPPYWQHDTPPVQTCPMTAKRHKIEGPKVLANIYPYAKYTSAAALKRPLKQTDQYSFMKHKEKPQYRIKASTRLEDLLSRETTRMFEGGAVLEWKGDRAKVVLPTEPETDEEEEAEEGDEGRAEEGGEGDEGASSEVEEHRPSEGPPPPTDDEDEGEHARSALSSPQIEYIDLTEDD